MKMWNVVMMLGNFSLSMMDLHFLDKIFFQNKKIIGLK